MDITLAVLVVLPTVLAGCFGNGDIIVDEPIDDSAYPQPWERADLIYDDTDVYSRYYERHLWNRCGKINFCPR